MIRLNKFIAQAGIASRRAADEMIQAGRVQVNGRVVYTMGVQIDPARDKVLCDGKPVVLRAAESVTILLNKPAGYLTTRDDPQGRPTVLDLVPPEYHRLHPVGRLDLDSEGLLLLTDDGELTQLLTHPSFEHEKEYWVMISGRVPEPALRKLNAGVDIGEGIIANARVQRLERVPIEQRFWLDPDPNPYDSWLVFTVHEGRKRQIRLMCDAVRLTVKRLVRVRISSLHIGDLRPGQWRPLTQRQRRAIAAIKARGE